MIKAEQIYFIFNHFKIIKAENNGLKIEVAAKMAEE